VNPIWTHLFDGLPLMPRNSQNTDSAKVAPPDIVPAATPEWITAHLIAETIRVWQPYYAEVITPEEAVTMIRNVGRLYEALSSEP
jgi:hypothetical protein